MGEKRLTTDGGTEQGSQDSSLQWEIQKTGWTIEDVVDEVEDLGDDPEAQYYYVTYSDVFHTTPRCPHIQNSENLDVTGRRSNLNGPYMAGANRVAGPSDRFCDLTECSWCEENSGWHPMEHPGRERIPPEDETESRAADT